jgi:hypothetical protein
MPTVEEYLSGFNVKQGQRYGSFVLKDVYVDHHSVVRWNVYEYPTELIFSFTGRDKPTRHDDDKCLESFYHHVQGERIIRTSANRPYLCTFIYSKVEVLYENHELILKCTGHAQRVKESIAQTYT